MESSRSSDEAWSGTTLPDLGAPDLLGDPEERRKRDAARAALFGEEAEPQRIGRFLLLRRLGAGGMGVVYAARDEQLERDVAVKLLRSRGDGGERERLLREAQAMARLTHPHVVTVYEVGVHGEQLFVAMELVRGETLSAWLRAGKRTAREVIDVFAQAGRGLAAAHAAGIVHRDFKPENVMLDEAGTAKVLDFGLARHAGEPGEVGSPAAGGGAGGETALDRKLTVTGTLMGTPAYMAPEQLAGEPTDARTDQYAFCVALHEGLYGQRPWKGDTIQELARAAAAGKLPEPPAGSDVPAWVRRAVARGLAFEPGDRWPSMAALLDELAKDPAAKRRRLARAAAATLAGALGIAVTAAVAHRSSPPVCEGAKVEIEAAWGPSARAAVREGLGKTGVSYAADAAARASGLLDAYAAGWAGMHREACLSNVRGEQSSELLDLRMGCLQRRRGEVQALVKVLSEGAPGTAERAVSAAESLSPLAACADVEALRAQVKPPADAATRAAVERVREALQESEAQNRAGLYTRALAAARAALADAERTGYRPIVADAAYDEGSAHISLAAYDDAIRSMERAYFEALATGHDTLAAHAARQLYTIIAYHQGKKEAGEAWGKSAGAFVDRAQAGDTVLRADFLNTRALVATEAGQLDAAGKDYEAALAIYERSLGPDHAKVAMLLGNMAQVAYLKGRYEESASRLTRALAIRRAALGEDHPDIVTAQANLSLVRLAQGKTTEAIELLQRALAAQERVLGKDHPKATFLLNNLGDAHMAAGRPAAAVESYRQALAILERDKGANRARVARTRASLGDALVRTGHLDEGIRLLVLALAIRREVLPKEHPDTADSLVQLGHGRLAEGKADEAVPLFREAAEMVEHVQGKDHPNVALALTGLGQALVARGDVPGAKAALERAVAILGAGEKVASDRGEARFWLAKVLVAGGRPEERARAAELAGQALSDYRSAGDGFRAQAAELEAWTKSAGLASPLP